MEVLQLSRSIDDEVVLCVRLVISMLLVALAPFDSQRMR
jgi:hypothetical protein